MHALILGGTGLISTGITAQLLERGWRVTHLNRGATPSPFGGAVRVRTGERGDPRAVRAAASERVWDAVIDMLCFRPDEAELAVAAFAGRTRQYVMCSTVDVFTRPARHYPVDESSERAPTADFPYAYDKARCERILEQAHARGDLPLTILRPAATYLDSAVPSVGSFDLALERLRAGLPLIVHGDGSSIWTACHRDDVAAAFVAALGNPAALGSSYNVPGTEWLTWDAYWQAVADAVGVPARLLHIPTDVLVAADPELAEWCRYNFRYNGIVSADAARRDLGFTCRTGWAEGIARGLPARRPRPVDPVERARYQAVVDGWQRAVAGLSWSGGPAAAG
ncbi:NAD-dependent epimerase/dehydratase family protein [Kitasatospora indigofera]|uniref:NAD-dependent epimerase/dehydratase family protein n=1 Tax=Kitasatospora indigofera TaxID=67307 RepID=UPI0036D191A0